MLPWQWLLLISSWCWFRLNIIPHTTGGTQTHTETASDMVFQINHLQLSPRSSLHTPLMPNTPDQELLLMVNTLCSAHCMVSDVRCTVSMLSVASWTSDLLCALTWYAALLEQTCREVLQLLSGGRKDNLIVVVSIFAKWLKQVTLEITSIPVMGVSNTTGHKCNYLLQQFCSLPRLGHPKFETAHPIELVYKPS